MESFKKKTIQKILITIFIFNSFYANAQEENLKVLENWIVWSDAKNFLVNNLNKQAFNYLDKREKEI